MVARRLGSNLPLGDFLMNKHSRYRLIFPIIAVLAALQPLVGFAAEPTIEVDSVVLRALYAAEVPAQQTGLLLKIAVEEGAVVKKGQVLASLDPLAAKLSVKLAVAERDQAKAKAENRINVDYAVKAIEVAEAELKRSQESIREFPNSVSQSQIDVERLSVEKLNLEKKQAEHDLLLEGFDLNLKENELEVAKLVLERHLVRAPFDGTVVLVRGRVGEWVELGAPVLSLVTTNQLKAEGFLPVELASSDLVGKPVTFTTLVGERELKAKGTMRFVSPEMDPVTRQVRFWAVLDNTAGELRSGGQGTIRFD